MTLEQLANLVEKGVQEVFEGSKTCELFKFTPSIKMGRRYVGIEHEGIQYLIEINVTEAA